MGLIRDFAKYLSGKDKDEAFGTDDEFCQLRVRWMNGTMRDGDSKTIVIPAGTTYAEAEQLILQAKKDLLSEVPEGSVGIETALSIPGRKEGDPEESAWIPEPKKF